MIKNTNSNRLRLYYCCFDTTIDFHATHTKTEVLTKFRSYQQIPSFSRFAVELGPYL